VEGSKQEYTEMFQKIKVNSVKSSRASSCVSVDLVPDVTKTVSVFIIRN
jgi:hypothetical protein